MKCQKQQKTNLMIKQKIIFKINVKKNYKLRFLVNKVFSNGYKYNSTYQQNIRIDLMNKIVPLKILFKLILVLIFLVVFHVMPQMNHGRSSKFRYVYFERIR